VRWLVASYEARAKAPAGAGVIAARLRRLASAAALAAVCAVGPPASAAAPVSLAGPIPATVVEVIDGDTLSVRAGIWIGQAIETRVRIAGIDAPEMTGACRRERALARAARAFVISRLGAASGPARVRLYDVRYGKYAGRVLARVETAAGEDVGVALLVRGLARPYGGGRRASWCAGLAAGE